MQFIGIDPGETTGLVSFNAQDNETLPIWGIEHWQLDHIGIGHWFRDLKKHLVVEQAVVCCEKFDLVPGKSPAPWSLETTGLVRYFVETAGLQLHIVQRSAHKSLIKDKHLKKAGLYFPGEPHATDAARVATWYAVAKERLLTWTLL